MPDYQIAATFFSLALALMTLFQVAPAVQLKGSDKRALCFALLQISLLGYLLQPILQAATDNFWLLWICGFFRNMIPTLFWMVCLLLFDDSFRLNRKTLAIPFIIIFSPAIGRVTAYLFELDGSYIFNWAMFHLPQWLEFGLIAHALLTVVRSLRDDLVESRRQLRVWLLGSVGFYIAVVVTMEQFFNGGPPAFKLAQPVMLALFLFAFYGRLLKFRSGLLFTESISQESPVTHALLRDDCELSQNEPEAAHEADSIDQLKQLMEEQKLYKQEGITISDLADAMNIQEYRLRQLINQQMGYRNFNDFLNGYRIQESCRRLISEQEYSLPVLSIALDTGFRSLSAFNRAFKERTGVTPSAYRKDQSLTPKSTSTAPLTDSETA
ncbi:helix-turn-helix domain-containing protein [Endozoicomonas ascidiicola]|uniref:helix-turn-helix domain-containing protein n=1 Tax=Endozoicomonas ascidiicola TaxID=1698521 RepID=UPI00082A0709|nr:helix-turn-helix transcriptional regulator [Endozoicomonas ascidiicola]